MFGLGLQEIFILAIIFTMLVGGSIAFALIIYYSTRPESSQADSTTNVRTCSDCGGKVSASISACPHCGRPMPKENDSV